MKTRFFSVIIILSMSVGTLFAQRGYQDDLYSSQSKTKRDKSENRSTRSESYAKFDSSSELIETYYDALDMRLAAYRSSARMSNDYKKVQEKYIDMLVSKYDPEFYIVMVINDKVWVEPRYITAMFDDDVDPVGDLSKYSVLRKETNVINVSLNFIDPWYNSFRYPYYSGRWGYDPFWDIRWGYDPFWGSRWGYDPFWSSSWGYYPYYGGYWGGSYYGGYWGFSYWDRWGWYDPYYYNGRYPHHNSGWNWGYYPSGGSSSGRQPIYYGGNKGTSGSNRGDYVAGSGFARPGSSARPSGGASVVRPADRPTSGAVISRPSTGGSNRPTGGTVSRPATNDRPAYERPSRPTNGANVTTRPGSVERPTGGTVSRPATSDRPAYERPSRPTGGSERPTGGTVSRPATSGRPAYERPSTTTNRPTTYTRPATPSSNRSGNSSNSTSSSRDRYDNRSSSYDRNNSGSYSSGSSSSSSSGSYSSGSNRSSGSSSSGGSYSSGSSSSSSTRSSESSSGGSYGRGGEGARTRQ